MTGTRYLATSAVLLSLFLARSATAAPRVAVHSAPPPHQHSSNNSHPPPHQHTSEHHNPTTSHTALPHQYSATHQGPAPHQHTAHPTGQQHLTPGHSPATHQHLVGHQSSSPLHPPRTTHQPRTTHHIVLPRRSGGGTLQNQLLTHGGGHTAHQQHLAPHQH